MSIDKFLLFHKNTEFYRSDFLVIEHGPKRVYII